MNINLILRNFQWWVHWSILSRDHRYFLSSKLLWSTISNISRNIRQLSISITSRDTILFSLTKMWHRIMWEEELRIETVILVDRKDKDWLLSGTRLLFSLLNITVGSSDLRKSTYFHHLIFVRIWCWWNSNLTFVVVKKTNFSFALSIINFCWKQ